MAILNDGTVIVNNWQRGIGESPLTGFGDIVNCDIHNPKGVLKIALAPTKISSTTVVELPTWITANRSVSTDFYAGGYQDSNVYKITSAGVVSTVSGASSKDKRNGIVWKGYLITVSHDSSGNQFELDGFDLSSTWDLDFARADVNTTSSNDTYAPVFTHPSDSVLYIGVDNAVASLEENSGQTFDPGTGGTFTWNASALDLPANYSCESLSQLGTDLMIGASVVAGSHFQGNNFGGLLFPWDRASASFSLPISLDEGAVRQQISRNGSIVFSNGIRGNYLITNGSTTQSLDRIGVLAKNNSDKVGEIYPDAKAFVNGEYLFGISSEDTGFTPAGIYGFKDGAWRRLTISTDEVGENNNVNIGSIIDKDGVNFLVGWEDTNSSAYGIDEFGKSNYRYTGYRAKVDSELFRVGTPRVKKSYQYCEVVLAKPLATGQGVKVSYRKNLSDSFTVIDTIDFATYGAINSYEFSAKIDKVENLQIRVELTTGASSTTSPELLEVRIK